jgi:hypothetical protein
MTVGTRTNSGDTYYYFKDTAPAAMRERWQDLTGSYNDHSFADLDEYYTVLYMLVSTMQGYDNFTEEDLYNIDWRDDSSGERLMWLYNNLSRAQFYDDIRDNGADGIFDLIGDMQDYSRAAFASYVYNSFLTTTGE